jgi:hypothetical protein
MKQFTPEQQKLIVEYRNEYVKNCAEMDRLKENIKFGFESLFDRLGVDTKEDKETVKAVKLGFKLFYNETKDEQISITENAAFIAEMGEDN